MHEVAGSEPGWLHRSGSVIVRCRAALAHVSASRSVAIRSPSSPSSCAAARFPAPYELGLTRLRDELGLVPVEYPTTRAAEASPEQRAADVQAAFADPTSRP